MFIHAADTHLGYGQSLIQQHIVMKAFASVITHTIDSGADFLILAGDVMHVPVPDMRVQMFTFAQLRRLHEAGIPAYVVHGSHDDNGMSGAGAPRGIIHLLEEIGYLRNVWPNPLTDEKTGITLAGIPGLPNGRDISHFYQNADIMNDMRQAAAESDGPSIFLFHCAITEMISVAEQKHITSMPHMTLPAGFDYYAGGHMHNHIIYDMSDASPAPAYYCYAGTPFAGGFRDVQLQHTGRPRPRGFVECVYDYNDNNDNNRKAGALGTPRFIELKQDRRLVQYESGSSAASIIADLKETGATAETVIYLLWPDDTAEGAMATYRSVLSEMRRSYYVIASAPGGSGDGSAQDAGPAAAGQAAGKDSRWYDRHGAIIDTAAIYRSHGITPAKAEAVIKALCITKQDGETKKAFEARLTEPEFVGRLT